jgi:hypothetical protein
MPMRGAPCSTNCGGGNDFQSDGAGGGFRPGAMCRDGGAAPADSGALFVGVRISSTIPDEAVGTCHQQRDQFDMADILRLIRAPAFASNPETAALRAEVEGLRLALSLAQESLREERADKEHWRDEAKQLRGLFAASRREPEVILAAEIVPPTAPNPEPNVVEAPALAPVAEVEPQCPNTEMAPAQSAAPDSRFRWWGRLFA